MQDFVSPSDLKHIIINNDTKRKERGIISKIYLNDYSPHGNFFVSVEYPKFKKT